MLCLLAALLLLTSPAQAEWSCPEPPPEDDAQGRRRRMEGEVMKKRMIGTRGESSSGSLSVEFGGDTTGFLLYTRLAQARLANLANQLGAEERALLAEPPPDTTHPEAQALLAAMLHCAELHRRPPLVAVKDWGAQQDEVPFSELLFHLGFPEPPLAYGGAWKAAVAAAPDEATLEAWAWRSLAAGSGGRASITWREAAERYPFSPSLPIHLARAAAALSDAATSETRPALSPARRAAFERLLEHTAPGSPWYEAQPRRVRRSAEPLRALAEARLLVYAFHSRDERGPSRADGAQAWLEAHPRHPRAPAMRWLRVAALMEEQRPEEAWADLETGELRGDPHDELLELLVGIMVWAEACVLALCSPPPAYPPEERRLNDVALRACEGLALYGYRSSMKKGEPEAAGAWWSLLVSGGLWEGHPGRDDPESYSMAWSGLLDMAGFGHQPPPPPVLSPVEHALDVDALLEEVHGALEQRALDHSLDSVDAMRLVQRQLLLAEQIQAGGVTALEPTQAPCVRGEALERFFRTVWEVPTGYHSWDRIFGRLMNPVQATALQDLHGCLDVATQAETWGPWQDRAEAALYRLDPEQHPNPEHRELRLPMGAEASGSLLP